MLVRSRTGMRRGNTECSDLCLTFAMHIQPINIRSGRTSAFACMCAADEQMGQSQIIADFKSLPLNSLIYRYGAVFPRW